MYCVFLVPVGCILGNPYGKPDEKVLIPGRTQLEIKTIEGLNVPEKCQLTNSPFYHYLVGHQLKLCHNWKNTGK